MSDDLRDRLAAALAATCRLHQLPDHGGCRACDKRLTAALAVVQPELDREAEVAQQLMRQRHAMAEERFAWQERGDRAEAALAAARETNRRLNARCQQVESKLATFERAVGEWRIGEQGTYVPLRSLAAIAKAVGREAPEDRWELHYQRVEQAERTRDAALATLARVREFADRDQDGICCSHVTGELRRLLAAPTGPAAHDCETAPKGIRGLLEHVGIDVAGKVITVDGVPIEEQVPCSFAVLARMHEGEPMPHAPHSWQPQPGMTPVWCPGPAGAGSTQDSAR